MWHRKPSCKSIARLLPSMLALLLVSAAGCSQHILSKQAQPTPEDHWIQTADDWTLHILHYKPNEPLADSDPVILCHGLSHNNTFWDIAPSISLAKYLQSQGLDVWSVSLRGAGQSTKPELSQLKQLFRLNMSVFNPAGLINRQPALTRLNWNVDDHIAYDIPATLNYVRKQTGHPQVHWIGHSLGAMIMFAYLATQDSSPINTFVGISGPMYLVRPANDVFEIMADQADFIRIGNMVTGTNLRAIFGTVAGNLIGTTPIDLLFFNDQNIEPAVMNVFYHQCEEDISPGQLDQLIRFLKTGHFMSYDGSVDYTQLVPKITKPVLQVVGQMDNMANPGFVAVIHDRLTVKDKQLRTFGKINGYWSDYGHDDIIIGRHARDDVFPYLYNWLVAHPATQPTTQPASAPSKWPVIPLPSIFSPNKKNEAR
jgi:pimeloyl-ACP methyl ester carboxylesterase